MQEQTSTFGASVLASVRRPQRFALLLTLSLVLGVLCTLSLRVIDPAAIMQASDIHSRMFALVSVFAQSTQFSFPDDLAFAALCFFVLAAFGALPRQRRRSVAALLMALVFAALMTVGRLFSQSDVGLDIYRLSRALFVLVAFFVLFYCMLVVVQYLLDNRLRFADASKLGRVFSFVFERHAFVAPLILILVCWLPYLVLAYPGTTDPNDVLDQLQQYHGIYSRTAAWVDFDDGDWLYMSNNNPAFSTILTNAFIDFGTAIGNQNLGMFLLVALQTVILACGFSSTLALMKSFSTSYVVRFATLVTFAVAPLFPSFALCITKDVIFTGFVLLYVVMLVIATARRGAFMEHKVLFVAFFLVALLMSLIRNNGIYMVGLTSVLMLLVKGREAKALAVVGVIVVVAYGAYGKVVLPALGVAPGSSKEMLSAPFQQTGRYLAHFPDEVTDSERAAIDGVLDYDRASQGYDPGLSDGVKETFRKDATSEDLKRYLATWAQMGLKHPGTYVAATAANCYAYFYPDINTGWTWMQLNRWGSYDSIDVTPMYNDSGFYMEQNPNWEAQRGVLGQWYVFAGHSPLGLTTNMGFCAWGVLLFAAMLVRKRDFRSLVPFIPLLVHLLVCILSPYNGNIRYALPLIACTPVVVAFALWRLTCLSNGVRDERTSIAGASHRRAATPRKRVAMQVPRGGLLENDRAIQHEVPQRDAHHGGHLRKNRVEAERVYQEPHGKRGKHGVEREED